jgi:hypothetical protein
LDFGLTTMSRPLSFAGPIVLRLAVSSTTEDLDLFAALRAFDPDGREVIFTGAHEPVPVALGWLRASHRKLDAARSTQWRPYHSHDVVEKLVPGEVYGLDVEIWPATLVLPPGYRLVLTIRGCDLVVTPPGRIRHDDPVDRPPAVFGGTTTVHTGGPHDSHLLLPLLPEGEGDPP